MWDQLMKHSLKVFKLFQMNLAAPIKKFTPIPFLCPLKKSKINILVVYSSRLLSIILFDIERYGTNLTSYKQSYEFWLLTKIVRICKVTIFKKSDCIINVHESICISVLSKGKYSFLNANYEFRATKEVWLSLKCIIQKGIQMNCFKYARPGNSTWRSAWFYVLFPFSIVYVFQILIQNHILCIWLLVFKTWEINLSQSLDTTDKIWISSRKKFGPKSRAHKK